MLTMKLTARILYRLVQFTVLATGFVTMYVPRLGGPVITQVNGFAVFVLCICGVRALYKQGYLTKTPAQVYAGAVVQPRKEFRNESLLTIAIVLFSQIAMRHA